MADRLRLNKILELAEKELGKLWQSKPFLVIGQKDDGRLLYHDLEKLPIILMAGTSGSGKTNLANCFIVSLLKRFQPKELNLFLVDCKVEFIFYKKLPNLFYPVSSSGAEGIRSFKNIEQEIDKRKQANIKTLFILVAIDEFSDLACQYPAQLENLVSKIAKDGAKIGIGLVLYTSIPSRDVITEKIDKVVETRIGFETASDNDSKRIIHQAGCTDLLGNGDGLYLRYIDSKPIRFQAPLITEEELEEL